MRRFIGVDLHKNNFMVCYRDSSGEGRKIARYQLSAISMFRESLKKTDIIGVESTGNTRYFVEKVQDKVESVKVINPSQFKVISHSVKKTDRNDVEIIAEFLSKDMVPEVRLKDKKTSQIASLCHTRDKLVKLRTALKNKVHNILNSYGIQIKKESLSSEKGLIRVLEMPVDEIALVELDVIVTQIRSLNESIKRLEKELCDRGKDMKGHKNITSIKGIGDKSGTILLSVIGDINDFESEKKLAAYFGIVPRVSASNETVHTGRITKRGSKLGRTTLVQCTLVGIRYSPYLNAFYQKIKARKGSGKAIIAASKKMLGIIYNTLKENWEFEDFPNFVLK